MVDQFLELIAAEAEKISSADITGCVKTAGVNPYLAAALGTGAGAGASYLIANNVHKQRETDSDAKALLAGLAGTGLGYYLHSRNNAPSVQQYEYQSAPGELTVEDIYG